MTLPPPAFSLLSTPPSSLSGAIDTPSTLEGAGHVWLPARPPGAWPRELWGEAGWGLLATCSWAAGRTQHTKDTATPAGRLHSL